MDLGLVTFADLHSGVSPRERGPKVRKQGVDPEHRCLLLQEAVVGEESCAVSGEFVLARWVDIQTNGRVEVGQGPARETATRRKLR